MQVGAHYTPLVNQDAGPQTRNPLVPVLRFLLRVFNLALMVVGLTLLVGAIYMEAKYSHKPDERPTPGPSPTPHPSPSPSPKAPAAPDLPSMPNFPPPPVPASPAQESPSAVAVGPSDQVAAHVFRRALPTLARDAWAEGGLSVLASKAHPWFIWVVAASSLYVTAVSSLGLTSTELHQRQRLQSYIGGLAVAMVLEAALVIVLFTVKDQAHLMPEDASGFWCKCVTFVSKHESGVKAASLISLGVQLAGLASASILHSIYQSAYYDWCDNTEEAAERTRDLLSRTVRQTYAGSSGGVWSRRMHEKYDLGMPQYDSSAASAHKVADLATSPSGGAAMQWRGRVSYGGEP